MTKRTTISNGIRWLRHLLIPVIIGFLNGALTTAETRPRDIFFTLLFGLIYFILYKSRRLRFDEENLYRIYGSKEKIHPFTSIVSLKKSGAKLNSRRMWRLVYLDKDERERKFLFLEGNFQHGSVKEFIKRLQEANPSVIIQESYFWDQVEKAIGKS